MCGCFASLGHRLCAAWVLLALVRASFHGPCLLAALLEMALLRLVGSVRAVRACLVHFVRERAAPEQAVLEGLAVA